MVASGTFTAETLAFRAWVPLRTVRFYVQEKLIDPPLGRGRGAHFTAHHLAQLQQARFLQNAGFTLDAIRERRGELGIGLMAMASFDALRDRIQPSQDDADLDPTKCIRIPMADGIELMISKDRAVPSPRKLVDLALQIRKIFGKA